MDKLATLQQIKETAFDDELAKIAAPNALVGKAKDIAKTLGNTVQEQAENINRLMSELPGLRKHVAKQMKKTSKKIRQFGGNAQENIVDVIKSHPKTSIAAGASLVGLGGLGTYGLMRKQAAYEDELEKISAPPLPGAFAAKAGRTISQSFLNLTNALKRGKIPDLSKSKAALALLGAGTIGTGAAAVGTGRAIFGGHD